MYFIQPDLERLQLIDVKRSNDQFDNLSKRNVTLDSNDITDILQFDVVQLEFKTIADNEPNKPNMETNTAGPTRCL